MNALVGGKEGEERREKGKDGGWMDGQESFDKA